MPEQLNFAMMKEKNTGYICDFSLKIQSVQSWQRGEYECMATVQGFPPARLINYLHIRGPPSVSLDDEIVAASGESLEIVCKVCL